MNMLISILQTKLSVVCVQCAVSVDTGYAIYVRYFSDVQSRTAFVAHFAGFLGGESESVLTSFHLITRGYHWTHWYITAISNNTRSHVAAKISYSSTMYCRHIAGFVHLFVVISLNVDIFIKFGTDVQHLCHMLLITFERSRSKLRSKLPYWKSSNHNSEVK